MKIIKYLVAALLIVSITKKIHVASDELEYYDAKTKTAQMSNGQTYVGIMEYSQPTTPPNVLIPALKPFTQISTQNYTNPSKHFVGGLMEMTSLYGIAVAGSKFHIKLDKKTIGTYWPINKIAQLSDGQTYVAIIEEQVGNYKKHGFYATGPIWTQFNAEELSKQYNISTEDPDFKSRVSKIGTVQKHKQSFVLYGVSLYPKKSLKSEFFKPLNKHLIIEKEATIPGMDKFTKNITHRVELAYQNLTHKPESSSLNSAGLYSILP